MMQGRDTMMIELIMSEHTVGGYELLNAHEEALYALGGRPHWGQVNSLTGSNDLIAEMYPRYQAWQRVHAILNASGVFDSPFSKRVGSAATVQRLSPIAQRGRLAVRHRRTRPLVARAGAPPRFLRYCS